MSAVIERIETTSVEQAQVALDAVRRELAALDERLALHQRDADENDLATQQHRVAKITAVGAGLPPPKAPKLKVIDADVVPILRGKRREIAERVAECEGLLRRACVEEVERRYDEARHEFADAATMLIDAWRDLVGARQLLDQAGVKSTPLPESLYTEFSIPALGGKMRGIAENHWAHFIASHSLAQGELAKATRDVRAAVERDIGMKLPW